MCVEGEQRGFSWSESGPWTGCHAGGRMSVVVMVSDSCPCYHPEESNSRWCCGDRPHLDLSHEAFAEIGKLEQGVIDLKVPVLKVHSVSESRRAWE